MGVAVGRNASHIKETHSVCVLGWGVVQGFGASWLLAFCTGTSVVVEVSRIRLVGFRARTGVLNCQLRLCRWA